MLKASKPRIIVVGHAALDSVYRIAQFPSEPTKVRAIEHIESGGGSAGNAACAIARLGADVAFWCRLGADDVGQRILRGLMVEGIETRHVRLFEGARSSQSAVIVDARGERLIISDPDHGVPADPAWLPVGDVPLAHALLSDLRWFEGTRAAFEAGRANGIATVADIDVTAGAKARAFLPLIDYAIFSTPGLSAFAPHVEAMAALDLALDLGARHAGVTRGAEGYMWKDHQGREHFQPAIPTTVIDTTGAGDAFHGGFTWALAQGRDDVSCARIGAAVAALKCRKLGARAGLPSLLELQTFLQGHPA